MVLENITVRAQMVEMFYLTKVEMHEKPKYKCLDGENSAAIIRSLITQASVALVDFSKYHREHEIGVNQ